MAKQAHEVKRANEVAEQKVRAEFNPMLPDLEVLDTYASLSQEEKEAAVSVEDTFVRTLDEFKKRNAVRAQQAYAQALLMRRLAQDALIQGLVQGGLTPNAATEAVVPAKKRLNF